MLSPPTLTTDSWRRIVGMMATSRDDEASGTSKLRRQLGVIGLAVALAIGVAVAIAVDEYLPPIAIWIVPIGITLLAILCLNEWARRDPIAFGSVAVPALVASLISVVLPQPFRLIVALAAISLISVFTFAPQTITDWWWPHVLRRPVWTPSREFNALLTRELVSWADALDGPDPLTSDQIDRARQALARMQSLVPPDAEWASLRNEYVAAGEQWIVTDRDEANAEVWAELNAGLDAREARRRLMRDAA